MQWQENNDQYLAEALAWLRLRLARLAKIAPPEQPDAVAKCEESSGWFGMGKRSVEESAPPVEKHIDDVTKATQAMAEAAKVDPPPALVILGQRLGLSQFEQQILLLCAAMELDTRMPALCAQAQDDPSRPYPTFALALTLFDEPAWEALWVIAPAAWVKPCVAQLGSQYPLSKKAGAGVVAAASL